MVRSRIGTRPTEADASGNAPLLDPEEVGAPTRARDESPWSRLVARLRRAFGVTEAPAKPRDARSPLAVVLDLVPSFGRGARSVALGCLVAAGGGCDDRADDMVVSGVVREARSGRPLAGARIRVGEAASVATDGAGRFAIDLVPRPACDGALRVALGPVDTDDVRVELRCHDARGPLRWTTPVSDDEARRGLEDDGALLVVETRGSGGLDLATRHARREARETRRRQGTRALDAGAGDNGCTTSCHASVAPRHFDPRGADVGDAPRDTCVTCHDPASTEPSGLRAFDMLRSDPSGSTSATDLGAGALCAGCHQGEGAPQLDVFLGRGARVTPTAARTSAHRWIAETCTRCHDAHDGEVSARACASCHGDAAPGTPDDVARDYDLAIARAHDHLAPHLASLVGPCGRSAHDVRARGGAVALVDADGVTLGDCDGDGVIGADERALTVDVLPPRVRDAARDLAWIERDGSRGAHHPSYTFEVIAAIERTLEFAPLVPAR